MRRSASKVNYDKIKVKKIRRVLIYCVLLAIGPLGAFLLPATSVCYRIVERYAFTARRPGVGVHLAVMLPKNGPYQTIEKVAVNWPGDDRRIAHQSVDVILLDGVTGHDGTLEASFTYDVALLQGRVRWDAPVSDVYLQPEAEIESDAPALVRQAKDIGIDQSSKGIYQIYVFTARHLSWPTGDRMGGSQSALTAYETGIGVCGEHAKLMTALCRASGIPAKSIGGLSLPGLLPSYMTKTAAWLHPGAAHAWVEVHAEDGWEMVDSTMATRLPVGRLWFGRSIGQHLSYGELAQQDLIYDEMMAWGKRQGSIAGAMSDPLKFVAAVEEEGTAISPEVSVKKTKDVRWFFGAGSYVAILGAAGLLERHLRKTKRSSTAA
jgi:hypothetical protein